jgi:uncharacterized protein YjiS (DUF1127 family)
MSLLNTASDFSAGSSAIRRSLRFFGRAINNAIAAVIAQREQQANLTILRSFTDRELRDIGLARSQIDAVGLAEAAKDRMRAQRQFSARA